MNARDRTATRRRIYLKSDFGTTNFIANSLGVQLDEETLLAGRKEIAGQLGESDFLGSDAIAGQSFGLEGLQGLLFQLPVFMHLWFLWFLCWLVVAFLLYTSDREGVEDRDSSRDGSFVRRSVCCGSFR